jgi:hypothetical protein
MGKEPVAKKGVQMDDEGFFLGREGASLKVRPQVINPTKATALPAPLEAGISGDITPTTLSVVEHVIHELVILLRRPQPLPKLVVVVVVFPGGIWLPHFERLWMADILRYNQLELYISPNRVDVGQ